MSFAIVTDTSSNLPTDLLRKNNVYTIPFSYFIDGNEYNCTDTEKFNGKAFYDSIRKGVKVTTSQINPQNYIDFFEEILKSNDEIISINMSSGVSGSFNSAQIAAKQLFERYSEKKIVLIDTLGASLGEGILVLKAIECRSSGMSLEATADLIEKMRHRMCQIFMVDDLMHLRRSGRISGTVALVGTMLQIKPLLKGNESGEIVNFARFRGRKKSIDHLADKYDALVKSAGEQIVGIAHADCEEDALYLAERLKMKNPPKEIMIVCYEPVTGSHVGPGTLALFFEGDEGVRSK